MEAIIIISLIILCSIGVVIMQRRDANKQSGTVAQDVQQKPQQSTPTQDVNNHIKHTNRLSTLMDVLFYIALVCCVIFSIYSLFDDEIGNALICLGILFGCWVDYEFVKMLIEISRNIAKDNK